MCGEPIPPPGADAHRSGGPSPPPCVGVHGGDETPLRPVHRGGALDPLPNADSTQCRRAQGWRTTPQPALMCPGVENHSLHPVLTCTGVENRCQAKRGGHSRSCPPLPPLPPPPPPHPPTSSKTSCGMGGVARYACHRGRRKGNGGGGHGERGLAQPAGDSSNTRPPPQRQQWLAIVSGRGEDRVGPAHTPLVLPPPPPPSGHNVSPCQL